MVKKVNNNLKSVYRIMAVLLFITAIGYISYCTWTGGEKVKQIFIPNNKYGNFIDAFSTIDNGTFLVVDKKAKQLSIYINNKKSLSYPITIGEKAGNKQSPGDSRTPEGIFIIRSIDSSINWQYSYENDTNAPTTGAYGPWFIRLEVPGFTGIGIHGFYHDDSLGKRASHGCIRLNNNDLEHVVSLVEPGIPVIIIPGDKDLEINNSHMTIF